MPALIGGYLKPRAEGCPEGPGHACDSIVGVAQIGDLHQIEFVEGVLRPELDAIFVVIAAEPSTKISQAVAIDVKHGVRIEVSGRAATVGDVATDEGPPVAPCGNFVFRVPL